VSYTILQVRIDHIIYATGDLARAVRHFEQDYGLAASGGGIHPRLGTCNALVPVGNRQYVELMAVADPSADTYLVEALSDKVATGDRLFAVCVEADDLDVTAARLGIAITLGERRGSTGRVVRWRMAGLASTIGPDGNPFFIDWGDSDPDLDTSVNADVDGVAWVDMGGEESSVRQWVGEDDPLPFRFRGGPPGPLAIGLRRGDETVVIT